MVLCRILDCTPSDLIRPVEVPVGSARGGRAAAGGGEGIGDLKPKRARIRPARNRQPVSTQPYVEPIAVCSGCGRERRCRGAKTDNPLCHTCRRKSDRPWVPPVRVCSVCGNSRPCSYANSEHPMCRSCAGRRTSRREPCAFCGKLTIAAARTTAGAECGTCRTRRMRSKITCERCERHARPSAAQPGVCERCAGERVAQICQGCGAEEENYSAGRCGALLAASPRRRADPGRRADRSARAERLSGGAGRQPEAALDPELDHHQPRLPDAPAARQRRGRRSPTRRWTRSIAGRRPAVCGPSSSSTARCPSAPSGPPGSRC